MWAKVRHHTRRAPIARGAHAPLGEGLKRPTCRFAIAARRSLTTAVAVVGELHRVAEFWPWWAALASRRAGALGASERWHGRSAWAQRGAAPNATRRGLERCGRQAQRGACPSSAARCGPERSEVRTRAQRGADPSATRRGPERSEAQGRAQRAERSGPSAAGERSEARGPECNEGARCGPDLRALRGAGRAQRGARHRNEGEDVPKREERKGQGWSFSCLSV